MEPEDKIEDDFEELLLQKLTRDRSTVPWGDQPLPDFCDGETLRKIATNSEFARNISKIVRGHAEKLSAKGKLEEALALALRPITDIETLLSQKSVDPRLSLLLSFLYENVAWLIHKSSGGKKDVDKGIAAIKSALEIGKKAYGFSLYNSLVQLTLLSNLIASISRNRIEDITEELNYIENELLDINISGLNELMALSQLQIGLNNIYYRLQGLKFLEFSLKIKKLFIDILEKWLKFLNPSWKKAQFRLEYNLSPIRQNWDKLNWQKMETVIIRKRDREISRTSHNRFISRVIAEIKELIAELLYRVAKAYVHIGRKLPLKVDM